MSHFTSSKLATKLHSFLRINNSLNNGTTKFKLIELFNVFNKLNIFRNSLIEMINDPDDSGELLTAIASNFDKITRLATKQKIIINLPVNILQKSAKYLCYKDLLNLAFINKFYFIQFYNENSIDSINVIDCLTNIIPINPQKITTLIFSEPTNECQLIFGELKSLIEQCINVKNIVINPSIYDLVGNFYNYIPYPQNIRTIDITSHKIVSTEGMANCLLFISKLKNLKQFKSQQNIEIPQIDTLKALTTTTFDGLIKHKYVQDYQGPLMHDIKQFSQIKNHNMLKIHFIDPLFKIIHHKQSYKTKLALTNIIKNSLHNLKYLKFAAQITSLQQSNILETILKTINFTELYFYVFLQNYTIYSIKETIGYYLPLFKHLATNTRITYFKLKAAGIFYHIFPLLCQCIPLLASSNHFKVNTINMTNIISMAATSSEFNEFIPIFSKLLNRLFASKWTKNIVWHESTTLISPNQLYLILIDLDSTPLKTNIEISLSLSNKCNDNWLETIVNCLKIVFTLNITQTLYWKIFLECRTTHSFYELENKLEQRLQNNDIMVFHQFYHIKPTLHQLTIWTV